MFFEKPVNENYCANIVEIRNIVDLENCDNIHASIIFGFPVIISKETKIGDVGIYFPPETQLSEEYCRVNNLFRHSNLNEDINKKGYIEDNRRIRTVKFRGNQSVGLFMPLESLSSFCDISDLHVNDQFDKINNNVICRKYFVKTHREARSKSGKVIKKIESKIIENQFRFHVDTSQLGKNIHVFNINDRITITKKMHGTSAIFSNVLCKKKLNIRDKIAKLFGVNVVTSEYDNLYSSRRVVKNDYDSYRKDHFYSEDIWALANKRIKDNLQKGMTIYAEIVGYIPNGAPIQSFKDKCFDYGCKKGEFEIYVYRITYTNVMGTVFEFSSNQIELYCKEYGLKMVPILYNGNVNDLARLLIGRKDWNVLCSKIESNEWRDVFLSLLREHYLEKDCWMCKNKLPDEGIVVRREVNYIDVYKFKSFRFLEGETKEADKEQENIEDEN